ncbi:MAG: putative porin [Flavobacteriales bacterium Tduv]
MKQSFFLHTLFFLSCISLTVIAQEAQTKKKRKEEKKRERTEEIVKSDKEKDSLQIYHPTPKDYRYWQEGQEIQRLDTSLSINTYYNQNYLRKDYFGLLPFPNIEKTFNPLIYQPNIGLIPDMGFSAKQHNYLSSKEIPYFDVKTPTTQFFYESGMFLGQMLQTLFTHNPRKQFNYELQYKELHSRGRYTHQLSSNNFFLATINYHTRDEHYKLWAHYIRQDIDNEEKGGIQDIESFQKGKTSKVLPQNIPVRLNSANSQFSGKRWYMGQSIGLFPDAAPVLTYRLQYETKRYLYQEGQAENFFGRTYPNEPRRDESNYTHLKNEFTVGFDLNKKPWLEGAIAYDKLDYMIPSKRRINNDPTVPQKIQKVILSVMGNMSYRYDEWGLLTVNGQYVFGKKSNNTFILNTEVEALLLKDLKLGGKFSLSATPPAFNMIGYRSFYTNYNYYNPNFDNIKTQSLHLYLLSDKYSNLHFNIYNINNYTYFGSNGKPQQYAKSLNLFDVRSQTVFELRKFKWKNTLQYQNVGSGKEKLPLPEFILRSSLYYQNRFFEDNLLLQTGGTLNYFSKFKSREFFPVLNEFSLYPLQKNALPKNIGGYSFWDYFLNFEIYRIKAYLRLQHFNAGFTEKNYFVSPGYPDTGIIIRFGVLWSLFT